MRSGPSRGFALKYEPDSAARGAVVKLHRIAHLAHDLVADRRPIGKASSGFEKLPVI